MLAKITGEFEEVEFAEYAAKHIRETINSAAKIKIVHNRQKVKPLLKSNEYHNKLHGEMFYLLPTAINSYNYITAHVSRPIDQSLIDEPLLDRSVTLIVRTEKEFADKVVGILSSFGGYDVKNLSK